jgi:hypothetical protein
MSASQPSCMIAANKLAVGLFCVELQNPDANNKFRLME